MEEPKKRVLVVDDEKSITIGIGMNLKKTGLYEVETVNDPLEAIGVARDFRPDILVLDIVMPGMEGGELRNRIRAIPGLENVPSIMVTALVSNDEVSEDGVVETGDCLMLPKPIKFDRLHAAIEQMLDGTLS